MHGFTNMDFYSPTLTWLWLTYHLWVPNLLAAETNTEFLIWHHSLLISQLPGGRINIRSLASGYRFAFLAYSASAKTIFHGFLECLIHHHSTAQSIIFYQGIHFTEKEVWKWVFLNVPAPWSWTSQPRKLWRNIFLFFKQPNLWFFITAAWDD